MAGKRCRVPFTLLLLLVLGGCAGLGGLGEGDTLKVGQRESELVRRFGEPQEIQPAPQGGKIYVYTSPSLEPTAVMGGGAWSRPDQVYYWLDQEGVITRVARYPYGKRRFLFSRPETAPEEPQAALLSPAKPQPEKASPPTSPSPAAASPTGGKPDMEAASHLELQMTRDDVRHLLGPPVRTEGFRVGKEGLIVWFYSLEGPQNGRILTPLVFDGGRLSGWGEGFYRRRLRTLFSQSP